MALIARLQIQHVVVASGCVVLRASRVLLIDRPSPTYGTLEVIDGVRV